MNLSTSVTKRTVLMSTDSMKRFVRSKEHRRVTASIPQTPTWFKFPIASWCPSNVCTWAIESEVVPSAFSCCVTTCCCPFAAACSNCCACAWETVTDIVPAVSMVVCCWACCCTCTCCWSADVVPLPDVPLVFACPFALPVKIKASKLFDHPSYPLPLKIPCLLFLTRSFFMPGFLKCLSSKWRRKLRD